MRNHLNESQQQFSNRFGLAVSTVARYETDTPPKGIALMRLAEVAREAGRHDLTWIFDSAFAAAEASSGKSVVASAILRLRAGLRETQAQFAVRSGVAVSTIAKYETSRHLPPDKILRKLARVARENNEVDLVRIFESAKIPALWQTPEQRRISDLTFAFYAFLKNSDPGLLKAVERLILPVAAEERGLVTPSPALFVPPTGEPENDMRDFRTLLSTIFRNEPELSMLCAFVWLLIIPGGPRRYWEKVLVGSLRQILVTRDEPLSEAELDLLGQLGPEATKAAAEWRERERRVRGLTLPIAIRRIREELGMNPEQFAEKLKISISQVEQFESGAANPDVTILSRLRKLPVSPMTGLAEMWFIDNANLQRAFEDAPKATGAVATLRARRPRWIV